MDPKSESESDLPQDVAVKALEQKVLDAFSAPAVDFYNAALMIHELHEADPGWASNLVGNVKVSRRQLYNLADIGRLVSLFEVSKDDALSVGPTKLAIIARYALATEGLTANDLPRLFETAQITKANRLADILEGRLPSETKEFVFSLNETDSSLLRQIWLEFGAEKTPNGGLIKKELALKGLLSAYLSNQS